MISTGQWMEKWRRVEKVRDYPQTNYLWCSGAFKKTNSKANLSKNSKVESLVRKGEYVIIFRNVPWCQFSKLIPTESPDCLLFPIKKERTIIRNHSVLVREIVTKKKNIKRKEWKCLKNSFFLLSSPSVSFVS